MAFFAQAGVPRTFDRKIKSQHPAQRPDVNFFSFEAPTGPTAPTTTITVNSTSPVIANDGFCTLPEAIIAANTQTASGSMPGECPAGSSGGNTIVLAVGTTYNLVAAHNSFYGPNGLPAVTSMIFISGNGAIIQNAGGNFRLFYISPAGNLTLQNLTVQSGLAKGGNGGAGPGTGGGGLGAGGAIYNQGTLVLNGTTLSGNTAQGGFGGPTTEGGFASGGGGIGGDGGSSSGLFAGGGGGGGMGAIGGSSINNGGGGGGGGQNLNENGSPSAAGTGGAGGGTSGGAGGNGTPITPTSGLNGTFGGGGGGGGNAGVSGMVGGSGGNGGIGGGGGGCQDAACHAGNGGFGAGGGAGGNGTGGTGGFGGGGSGGTAAHGAPGFGGGIAGGPVFTSGGGGGGGMGGAIFNDGGTVNIFNSTLSGNAATGGDGSTAGQAGAGGKGFGGGLFNLNGTVVIDFSTVAGNTVAAGRGGTTVSASGVYNHREGAGTATMVLRNTILGGIGAANCTNDGAATFISSGYNLAQTPGTTCGFTGTGDLTGVDPMLAALAANGGPTNTQALQAGSQAIDRIPNGINGCQQGVSVDQRGALRAVPGPGDVNTSCDSGAYEFNSGAVPTSTPPPGTPRFFNYQSPPGTGDSAGEPSIGSNWTKETISHNHNVNGSPDNNIPNGGTSLYFGGFLPSMVKVTWDDCSSPAGTLWENKPLLGASTPRAAGDPILFTDHDTGRTFVCQLEGLTPAGSTIDITDDDGVNFIPSDGVIPSDVDHETIGGGRNHSPLPNPGPVYQNAIYYASQSIGEARAFRSDNGGLLFSQATTPMYAINDCSGLHGHIKVSPADGTVYVPNRGCGGAVPFHETGARQTLLVSEDNGITWTQRPIPDSTTHGNGDADNIVQGTHDPSVGVATDGTVYFGSQG
ncbi:MAG TPA: choice-of-anchor Q domain-containing protein, partial [Candidatus Acidoferrum sp.]|nr:choice-of-anchor Q domain-containing protein [Candidatus Acidoferrum sp.]